MKGNWFCVAAGTEVIALFRDDADVVRIGSKALRLQFLTYPLGAIILLSNMMMQSINKPLRANLLAATRRGLFFIPFLLILPRSYGLHGVLISQPLADVYTFAVSLPVLLSPSTGSRLKRLADKPPENIRYTLLTKLE